MNDAQEKLKPDFNILLRLIYLLVVSIGVFLFDYLLLPAIAVVVSLIFWFISGEKLRRLLSIFKRFIPFCILLILSFAFFGRSSESTVLLWQGDHAPAVDLQGVFLGTLMSLRIFAIVLASGLVRPAKKKKALTTTLRWLRVPETIALGIDQVLRSTSGHGPGKGKKKEKITVRLKEVLRGDFSFFTDRFLALLNESEQQAKDQPPERRNAVQDAGIVGATSTLTALTTMVKILPGFPIAPGHKMVVQIPLLLASSRYTSRWGGSMTGLISGIAAFLMGFGRFGIFEILKYIVSGIVADGLIKPLSRFKLIRYRIILCLSGMVIATSRFVTIVLVAFLVGAPRNFFLLLTPFAFSHILFGFLSGFVTHTLFKAVDVHISNESQARP